MKKLYYMVLDTETATLPFADYIAEGNAEAKKKIAIARPLVYDIGWTIMQRNGKIVDTKQFLIAETFSVPTIFNTAYYKEKRPIYLKMLAEGETQISPWGEVMKIFLDDLQKVDFVGAFNSMFDFKKAIPFTELYIDKLYSPNYFEWEKIQYSLCRKIISEPYKKNPEKDFDPNNFKFRGREYPLFDIWGLACQDLLNNRNYKKMCLENKMLTNSGDYFKTSAESSYRYLCRKYNFEEAHTALEDAKIESFILSKILHKHKMQIGIIYFPFRSLGHPVNFLSQMGKDKVQEAARNILDVMGAYVGEFADESELSAYKRRTLKTMRNIYKEFLEE